MYKIIIDYGKPFEELVETEEEVFEILNNCYHIQDNYNYFDIIILEGKNDLTDYFFNIVKKGVEKC